MLTNAEKSVMEAMKKLDKTIINDSETEAGKEENMINEHEIEQKDITEENEQAEFNKMGYAQRLEIFRADPEKYKRLTEGERVGI